jgi:deoxyribonuclease V
VEVLRGASKAPLYVSAVGIAADDAATAVRAMHGPHRIPTLLARVDAIARAR